MKFFIKSLFIILFLIVVESSNAQNTSIIVELKNIEILRGNLFISLSNDSLQFANFNINTKCKLRKIAVKSSNETLIFKNLNSGWYAIAVFQDLNGNDSLDTGKFKIPAEPFGFSNNALAKFKPPWFKDARFYVDKNKTTKQEIILVNRKPRKIKSETLRNEK